jgi:hypothetical protein
MRDFDDLVWLGGDEMKHLLQESGEEPGPMLRAIRRGDDTVYGVIAFLRRNYTKPVRRLDRRR